MELRRLRLTTFTLIALLVMAGTAIAGTNIGADPRNQTIVVGTIGTYTIMVDTDDALYENHTISFDTLNDSLLANLTGYGVNTGVLSRTGSGNWTPVAPNITYNFTFMVEPQSGITTYEKYPLQISDGCAYGSTSMWLNTTTIATVVPVPEITTIALVGIGLIGLVALMRRKE